MTSRQSRSAGAPTLRVRRPDPAVWQRALALAGGDVRRLEVAEDGTVRVRNSPGR